MPCHTSRPLTMDDVEMVCPLDPAKSVYSMEYNADESQLIVTLTIDDELENGPDDGRSNHKILILDAATGQKIQELPIFYDTHYYAGPDFLVWMGKQELTLLLPDESGQYRPVWTVDMLTQPGAAGTQYMEMVCDGKRLSVVSFQHDRYYCPEGRAVVEVYDQTGQLFAGELSFSNFWPTQSNCAEEENIPTEIYTHVNDLSVTWK